MLAAVVSRYATEGVADEITTVRGQRNALRREASTFGAHGTNLNVNARATLAVDNANTITWQAFANSSRFTNDGDSRSVVDAGSAYAYPHTYYHASRRQRQLRRWRVDPQFAKQLNYGSMRRDLEAYALYKLSPASQVRITALNILRPDNLSVAAWRDAASSQESVRTSPSYRGWRLQYEHKL